MHKWLVDMLTSKVQVSTKTVGKMLIRRRLKTFLELVKEFALLVDLTLVRSNQNKVDVITRVPLEMKLNLCYRYVLQLAAEWSSTRLRKYTCTVDILVLDKQLTFLGRLPHP